MSAPSFFRFGTWGGGAWRMSAALLLLPALADAQPAQKAKPPDYHPTAAELDALRGRNTTLIAALRAIEPRADADLLADAVIYRRAVDYVLRFPDRFYRRECYAEALGVVDTGLHRVAELGQNAPSWPAARGLVCRGFRSAVDGSIQPYCVWVPKDYDPKKPTRLDVILHGRNATLNEVSFLASAQSGKIIWSEAGAKGEPGCLKLYVFGRGNTSSFWAGEADVYEALASVCSRYNVDPDRIVLRGFSMGGTSAWQLGSHDPSRWAAVEVGAGYVETRPEVLQTIDEPWQRAVLPIHDASNCAVNLTNVPFVSYAGSLDPQRAQHAIVRQKLAAEGYVAAQLPRARFLVGEGVGHSMTPEMKRRSEAFLASLLPRRAAAQFHFVAYTPRYGAFGDFRIDALERLYERAELRGTRDRLRTSNVWVLQLGEARTLEIDGQQLTGREFTKTAHGWQTGAPAGLRKRAGLQGPIDDAFQEPFLCVPPAGGADAQLERFRDDFACYLHGDIRVKAAADVTATDVTAHNLILFGDPATNPWIAKVLPGLPLQWTDREIILAGRAFSAATHTVALIYPNPLNPNRYVVLNTGHTFSPQLFDDTHWLLYPRLGDYAVLDKKTRAVQLAGLFDREWKVKMAP